MTEINRRKEEILEAQKSIDKTMRKAVASEMGEIERVSITVDELKRLERLNRKTRKKRVVRLVSSVAVAMIVFGAVIYLTFPDAAVPVDADKNTEQRVETGDGEIVINEGDGIGESGMTEIVERDEHKLPEISREMTNLCVPRYIPEKYLFEILNIEKDSNGDFTASYIYRNDEDILLIEQRYYISVGNKTSILDGEYEALETDLGTVYFLNDINKVMTATVYLKNNDIKIKGVIKKDEIINILQNIKMP